ncbi:MAG: sugar phosphate nucleotidyltransferase [Candidatus Woesearchaeota archaeon]
MKVIIPMAGKGTRLRPHTHTRPKPLMFIAGKPMLGHILDSIKDYQISEVIFVISGFEDVIRDYVKKYKFKSSFVHQKEALGPAHAIWQTRDFFKCIDEEILIIYADTIFETDMNVLKKPEENIIWVKEVKDPRRFGVVILKNGNIINLEEKAEKPKSNLAITGMYFLKSSKLFFKALDYVIENNLREKGEFYINTVLIKMMKEGEIFIPKTLNVWLDCGTPETVLTTNQYLLKKNHKDYSKPKKSIIVEPVYIGKNSIIKNSIIGPYVSIGDDTHIENSIIKNSIINNNAHIQDTQIKDSLIGFNTEVKGTMKIINIGDDSKISYKE